jgi:hypothetical protein
MQGRILKMLPSRLKGQLPALKFEEGVGKGKDSTPPRDLKWKKTRQEKPFFPSFKESSFLKFSCKSIYPTKRLP